MSSIDILDRIGPRPDRLGLSLFVFHLGVGLYALTGWLIPSYEFLIFYMVFLPAMATQWSVNCGSCVLNNIETWLRTGRWRDPENPEEAGFLMMMCHWLLPVPPHPILLDRFCYSFVVVLWLLAFGHFTWLTP